MVRYTIQITTTAIIVTDEEGEQVIIVRKNSGADIGTEPRLNFIEGANITLTIVDDPANNEIDITIAGPAAAESVWLDEFFPAPNPSDPKGNYATYKLIDGDDITVYHTFMIPDDITTITVAEIQLIPEGTGDLRWQCNTDGAACGEDFELNQDSIGVTTTAVTNDEKECLDIRAALTGFAGGDTVGIKFIRSASHGDDTVDADVYYLGILIQGTV